MCTQVEGRHYGEASCREYRASVLAALPHRHAGWGGWAGWMAWKVAAPCVLAALQHKQAPAVRAGAVV